MSIGSETREEVLWHDLECTYSADLALWRELAGEASGPVLELGAGTGRVALELAREGHEVVGVEASPPLAEELDRRAERDRLPARAAIADLAGLELGRRFALVIAPMHVLQMVSSDQRRVVLAALARHLEPGGTAALAIVEPGSLSEPGSPEVLPDIRERLGWVYSSRPLWVESTAGSVVVKRLRERVSPSGEIERSVHAEELALVDAEDLEREAGEAGLEAARRRRIDNGDGEADTTVVILRAP